MSVIVLALMMAASEPQSTDALRLRLAAPKPRVLLGEPVKLNLTWTALRQTQVVTDALVILLDDGNGFRPYSETTFGTRLVVHVPEMLKPGEERKTSHVLAVSGGMPKPGVRNFRLAFPKPGHYRLKARYETLTSNVVTIEIVAPKGQGAELFSKLRSRPELLSEEWAFLEASDEELVRALVEQYPDNPILARQRVLVWKRRIEDAHARARQVGAKPGESDVVHVLREMEATPLENTPFDEDRLLLAAETRIVIGDRQGARQIYEETARKYPDGHGAEKAKRWLGQEEAAALGDHAESSNKPNQ